MSAFRTVHSARLQENAGALMMLRLIVGLEGCTFGREGCRAYMVLCLGYTFAVLLFH